MEEEFFCNSPRTDHSNDDSKEQHFTADTPSPTSQLKPENYDDSCEPKKIRSIGDIYNETEEVEFDQELLLMGVEEPASYKQDVKDQNWK